MEEQLKSLIKEAVREVLKEMNLDKKTEEFPSRMTVRELSSYLKKSESWIYANIGMLPHEKTGRTLVFNRGEIDQWTAGNKKENIKITTTVNKKKTYRVV